jgi:prepilin-type N-terminal cleavage/methylation domain-containing protein
MRKQKGFTLIELMIVVAIIGILAAVAIPKFADMLEKAREGATKGNVGAIKSAISIFYGDQGGTWPTSIDPTVANNPFSKYMDRIPAVKVTHSFSGSTSTLSGTSSVITSTTAAPTLSITTDGWIYNTTSGDIWVNNNQTDTRGTAYSSYGFN